MKDETRIDIKRINADITTIVICIIFIVGLCSASLSNYYIIKINNERLENKIDLLKLEISYLKKSKNETK